MAILTEARTHELEHEGSDLHSVVELHFEQVSVVGFILAATALCWSRICWLRL